jgi:glycine oxidase
MSSPDAVIVGGGVIGCAAAWYLAKSGARVELFDRGPLGGEATSASAGILAPLAESVTPGPFVELALAGLRAFEQDIPALLQESGLDPEYRVSGVLRLAMTAPDVDALRTAAQWQANARLDLRWLEPRQVTSLEPALGNCAGGLLSPREGHVNPPRLVAALAAAAARCGAALHEHSAPPVPWMDDGRLRGVIVGDERRPAGHVVLASGAWSGAWADAVGLRIPVRPVKGQMLLLRAVPPPLRHVVFAGHAYFVPRVDGTVYVGATQEEAGFDRRVTAGGVQELTEMVSGLLPSLSDAELVRAHAGLRPGTADGLPLIGPTTAVDGLILATGHFRNGVLMSLVTGRVVAALVNGGRPEVAIEAFRPERFAAVRG